MYESKYRGICLLERATFFGVPPLCCAGTDHIISLGDKVLPPHAGFQEGVDDEVTGTCCS